MKSDFFGYVDCVVVNGDEADIIDWKFAVNWYPADSPQFHAYALGVWDLFGGVETIRVHAVHPFRDEIDIETFTRTKDYERLSGQVAAIIARAKANRPEDYTISAQCAYCGLAGKCAKLAATGFDIARRYAPDLALPDIDFHGSAVTDPQHFEVLLRAKPALEKACEGWSRAALEMHDAGTPIPNCEVTSRAGRKSVVSARGAFDLLKQEVAPGLKPEDFIDACSITSGALDDLVKAAAPNRKKGKTVEYFQSALMDADLVTQGGGGRYIRPVRQ